MGCDAYADEDGIVWIIVSSHEDPNNVNKCDEIYLTGFKSYERLDIEFLKGEER